MLVAMMPLESAIREFFERDHHDVLAVYLFGSQARGTSQARSDVDIAVLLTEQPPATMTGLHLDLEGDLERWLGSDVDLVVLNGAPPDLVHRVLRDGHVLIDRDPSARIRFEVQSRNEYFDLRPVLELCRRRKRSHP